jgi:uncharacterized membrane protein YphA (DoxX/SURF4 family)
MPSRALVRAFYCLWWTLGIVIFYLSATTARGAVGRGHDAADLHAMILGTVEAIAGLLFLVPRTMFWGGVGLLATFAAAFLIHAHAHHFAAQLLIYAAAVLFVMVHGPATASRDHDDDGA